MQPKKQCLPSGGTAREVSQYWLVGTILGRSLTCLGQSRRRWAHPPFCKRYFSCWVYTNKTHNFLMAKLGMCSKIALCEPCRRHPGNSQRCLDSLFKSAHSSIIVTYVQHYTENKGPHKQTKLVCKKGLSILDFLSGVVTTTLSFLPLPFSFA